MNARESPIGIPMLVVAHEITGTVTLYGLSDAKPWWRRQLVSGVPQTGLTSKHWVLRTAMSFSRSAQLTESALTPYDPDFAKAIESPRDCMRR